jgi:tetratricopeptide (TPR) repeat protein
MDLADLASQRAAPVAEGEPTLPGYRLAGLIRTSGQGRVFQAIRLADARKVALKFIRPDRLADPQARARFAQEARTLALLDHPGIVRVIDEGELADGQLWLATEYISGLPLNEYVSRLDRRAMGDETPPAAVCGTALPTCRTDGADGEATPGGERRTGLRTCHLDGSRGEASSGTEVGGDENPSGAGAGRYAASAGVKAGRRRRSCPRPSAFPLHEVLELFVQICDAVQAAHNVGVLHRDLKPSNILVDDDGRPHVLDFGLARLPEVTDPALLTLTGQFLGSPAWCSPEQIEARPSAIDVRSDVYSLGVILYHVLTGEFPYPVDQPLADLFDAIRHAEPERPSAHAAFLDSDLEMIILKAIAKEKDRRYPSAGALRDEVRRYLRGEPILARGDGWAYLAVKFLRRHPVLTGVAAAAFLLSLVYGGAMTGLYRRAVAAETKATAHADDARQKFRLARQTADFMISQIDEKLKHVPGAGPLRKELLERAYEQVQTLANQQSDDPELQADLAEAYKKLGDIALGLGRNDEAAENRSKNLEIREDLAARFPDNPSYQERLSIALVLVGDLHAQRGDFSSALPYYERSLEIDERLVVAHPGNLGFADNLGFSYERLGSLAWKRLDIPRCTDYWNKHYAVAQRLFEAQPSEPLRLWSLYHSVANLSLLNRDFGERNQAGELSRQATDLAERLYELEPTNARYVELLIRARWNQANQCGADRARAVQVLEQASVMAESLVQAEPQSDLYQGLLASTCFRMGEQFELRGDLDRASDSFHRAQAVADESPPTAADNPDRQWLGVASHLRLSSIALRREAPDESRQHRDAAVETARRIVECHVSDADVLSHMATVLVDPAVLDVQTLHVASAAVDRAVQITGGRHDCALEALAKVRTAAGDREGAAEAIRRILELLPPGPSPRRQDVEAMLAQAQAELNKASPPAVEPSRLAAEKPSPNGVP